MKRLRPEEDNLRRLFEFQGRKKEIDLESICSQSTDTSLSINNLLKIIVSEPKSEKSAGK
jgi:hypothetical protein